MTMIRTLLADPPWQYADKLRMESTKRSSDDHYDTLTVPQVRRFLLDHEIAPRLAMDAFLFLWTTNSMLVDGVASSVCRAWGFRPKQIITWVKGELYVKPAELPPTYVFEEGPEPLVERSFQLNGAIKYRIGLGHYTRGVTEHLILATRGTPKVFVKCNTIPNVLIAPRGRHSAKPEASYQLIESLVPGPYLELFARTRREGWEQQGHELR